MFFLLAFSGNPLFVDMPYSKLLLSIFAFGFFIFVNFRTNAIVRVKPAKRLFYVLFLFLLLSVFQFLYFNFVTWVGLFGFLLKIIFAYSIVYYYSSKNYSFEYFYIKVLSFLCLISLPLFFLNYFGHFGYQLQNDILKSSFFYTSHSVVSDFVRNSGMFWEPGAFAGYIILAFLFIVTLNGKFQIGEFKKEFILLLIGLISTFSTTGYIVFGFMASIYFLNSYSWFKLFIAPFFVFVMLFFFSEFSFLHDKVLVQYEQAVELGKFEVSNTRFGALVMDIQYIYSSPFFGNGMHFSTRYRFHPWVNEDIGHGNGMSNFIVYWGFPVFLFWLFSVFSFFRQNLNSVFISILLSFVLLLVLQGEQFLNYPLFLVFFVFSAFPVSNKVV